MNIKVKILIALIGIVLSSSYDAMAQGWQRSYKGVMLQGFFWDSYEDTQWSNLEAQADEIAPYFSLIWIPNSGYVGGYNSMGYDVQYYFNHNSCFGTEQQLRSMINTYKAKGTGFIADVVVNHRKNLTNWVDFPSETYNGVTYEMKSTDIVADDDGGEAKAWADKNGYSLSLNNDEGQGFGGFRDLDHKSENVQNCVKAYTKFLLEDLGYTGFRYDMVKGFSGSHIKDYNEYAFGNNPIFSVGEYWDGNVATVGGWISSTNNSANTPTSAAFDFPLKYKLNACCNYGGYYGDNLKNGVALAQGSMKQYAVTFAENHDTNYEQNQSGDCLKKDTLAANAVIIGFPGTPCVFLTHWRKYKNEIRQMILARQVAGVTNTASFHEKAAVTGKDGYYAWSVLSGENLYCVVGNCTDYATPAGYTLVIDGAADHYRYYLKNTTEMAWSTLPSCSFENPTSVQLIAVSADPSAKIVYTLDGSEPTASSTAVESGTSINLDKSVTLKYGLLKDGVVSAIETRDYVYTPFTAHDVNVYFRNADWKQVNFHSWDSFSVLNDSWPGKNITAQTKTITDNDGQASVFYYRTYNIPTSAYSFGLVVNNLTSSSDASGVQTVDVTGINSDRYFELGEMVDGKYTIKDITSQYVTTAISPIFNTLDTPAADGSWYTLNGIRVSRPATKGIYLRNGKKYIVK